MTGLPVGGEPGAAGGQATAGDEPDEATLVARARDGDVASFERLVVGYQGRLYRLALRMLSSGAEAEDAVQETFVSAWRRLATLQSDAAFGGWLYRMATNRCLKALRARRPTVPLDAEADAPAHPGSQPERAAEARGGMAALTEALQGLTPQQRACWLLREVHERSYAEIAETVQTSETAVRGRIARARAQLAEVMQPWR